MTLENELENEQEYIVNRLQKQLTIVTAEKKQLEAKLQDEQSGLFDTLDASLVRLKGTMPKTRADEQEKMASEISQLRQQQSDFEKERADYRQRNARLRDDLEKRKAENNRLQQKIMREHNKFREISDAKTLLERNQEMDLEALYNLAIAEQSKGERRASSPILSFVRDRSRTSSTYTSDHEGDDMTPGCPSASPGNRSRTSSRASSGQKLRPLLEHPQFGGPRTPSPSGPHGRRGRANSHEASPGQKQRWQPSLKDRPGQPR